MFTSLKDDWETPDYLFNILDDIFHFDIDLCASDFNHLCSEYYTKDRSCFDLNCNNKTIFCNPPYGRKIGLFIKKCFELSKNNVVVMLLPSRTDTSYFHDYILPHCYITFIRGRLKFSNSKNSAPFPSMICVFKKTI